MKRLIYFMFVAISALLLFTGCKKDEPNKPTEFTVTFHSDGGSEVSAVKVEENKKLLKPTNPTKDDLIFVDWFKEATWVNAWDFDKDVVTKDITLYAKWTTITYTVTFNTNGGSTVDPLTVAKGSKAVKPVPPTKKDAAFDNWYQEVALTNVYDFGTAVNSNITLYAKWITVTSETLLTLVDDARKIYGSNYTDETYNAMMLKLEAASVVLQLENPTSQQIATAYTELSAAMSALVALPKREVTEVYVSKVIDGIVYVTQGSEFNLFAYAVGANDEPATDRRVIFTYDALKLAEWAKWEIHVDDNSIWFSAKDILAAGTTVSVTVKSAENPAISKTVTLKVAGQGELKTMFINAINALPSPDKISYEHCDAINKAMDMYYTLTYEDQQDEAVKVASEKLYKCDDAYHNLPIRIKYTFKGNICTMIGLEGVSNEEEMGEFTFAANGAFPAGTYTQNGWTSDGKSVYYQTRITLKSDGTGLSEYREAKDANGTEATVWEEEMKFTYTNQGSQAAGGMFTITFENDEPEESNTSLSAKSISSANTVRAPYAIFKMRR